MVLVTETGATLADLAALVAPNAQRLAPDPWRGNRATIGGAIAAHRFGVDRLRRGTWRDALLGARVVHWDGTTSKTGGRVVKNVAGYDLGRLHVGAQGALALLGEVNLRLVPRPESSAVLVAAGTRAHAVEALLEIHRSALAPVAMLLVAGDILPSLPIRPGSAACLVRFEGRAEAVRWQADETLRRLGGAEWEGDDARTAWRALQAHAEPRAGSTLLRMATLPVDVGLALETLAKAPVELRSFVGQFGVGTSDAQLDRCSAAAAGAVGIELARRGARLDPLYPPHLSAALAPDAVRDEIAARTHAAFLARTTPDFDREASP
jgi:glycolate oxidase FAD binding subunit